MEPPARSASVRASRSCLRLNEAYQEQYRLTKDKLLTMPKGKQFDFIETQIFGKFDLFCRRVIKLIDMFSTIHQFQPWPSTSSRAWKAHRAVFKNHRDFNRSGTTSSTTSNKFDRDYVEFNVQISDLEGAAASSSTSLRAVTSIEQS